MTTVGAFAVIENAEGHVLCVRHAYGDQLWALPGGFVESRDTPDTAVIREVREESNIEIQVGKLIGIYAKPYAEDVVIAFAGKLIKQEKFTPTREIAEIGFFPVDKLPMPMSLVGLSCIHDYVAGNYGVYRTFAKRRILKNKIEVLQALGALQAAA